MRDRSPLSEQVAALPPSHVRRDAVGAPDPDAIVDAVRDTVAGSYDAIDDSDGAASSAATAGSWHPAARPRHRRGGSATRADELFEHASRLVADAG